ncbi:type VI secretion system-associated protein TagO [Rhodoligotrophos defluvii]|uniref:type VI secretion system-associated protein TagO n=1 Tax=Rhodoligotrophos defluvii TaxID=2561934 RepID=UPI0010C988C5|nr:type VI secretion system-associated protein TagO [Rhodoligotrophos defluvii]
MVKRFISAFCSFALVCATTLPAYAAWQKLEEDVVTGGSITVMIMTDGTPVTPLHGSETIPTLVIRCYQDKTAIYVRWDGSIHADHAAVQYRTDDGSQHSAGWDLSSSHTATGLFDSASSLPLIKSLLGHHKLALVLAPNSVAPVSTTFDLDDLDQAIKPIREACGW